METGYQPGCRRALFRNDAYLHAAVIQSICSREREDWGSCNSSAVKLLSPYKVMPPGKRKSPFIGLKETVESPILYSRYTDKAEIILPPLAAEASQDEPVTKKTKKRKKREQQDQDDADTGVPPGAANGGPEHTPPAEKAEEASPSTGSAEKKQKKKKKGKTTPRKATSGPSNAEEAQQMRSILGIAPGSVQARPAPKSFSFGFPAASLPPEKEERDGHLVNGAAEHIERTEPSALAAKATRERQGNTSSSGQDVELDARLLRVTGEAPNHIVRRVFVGGMPFYYDEEQVREYWSYCGEIEDLDMMRFPDTGRFKGIAFITFAEEEGYREALKCDGIMIDEQKIKVEPCISAGAKSRGKKPTIPGSETTAHPSSPAPKTPGYHAAYVGNVPFDANQAKLKEVFEGCNVTIVRLHTDKETGKSKGYAHVHFADEESLDRAVGFNGSLLMGRAIKVGYAQPKKGQ